ncbi:hypothetical protein STCU_06253 [Strigomonas culicis]|uniref:Integral membrane bound transporter domain-containing protein n=1 Tax=Strigomonas culicis TaxID=28005 RepID=S9VSQ5_9TRYP|nr:hypothetical protein STCU_06253 [Strigomonas culicis]|eukprot:EPY26235.1 hypothetical protein STCU_06253 [Strigomonas culicis]
MQNDLNSSASMGPCRRATSTPRDNAPYGEGPESEKRDGTSVRSNSMALRDDEVSALYNNMKRSFANQQISRSHMFEPYLKDTVPPPKKADYLVNEETQLEEFPLTHFFPVVSRENLDADAMKYEAYYYTFTSEACLQALLFGARVTLFAVLPSYVLTEHPKTSGFFVASTIVPVMAALFVSVRCTVGNQLFLLLFALQAAMATGVTGLLMNCFGTQYSTSGWWCGAIFACLGYSLLGDLAGKRMMMMYTMIIMQMQHTTSGDTLLFPVQFARDLVFGALFSLLAVLLPFPSFDYVKAEECLMAMHRLLAAGLANNLKGFFAPVPIDAQVALNQVPYAKLRDMATTMKMLYTFCRYEPVQFDLSNQLRNERVQVLMKISMQLHSLSAAAQRRIDEGNLYRVGFKPEVRELEKRLEKSCSKLIEEMMAVLLELGKHVQPHEVLRKVNFDKMCDQSIMLADIVNEERLKMLFVKTLTENEVNSYLRTLLFARCLIEIAEEIQMIETVAKQFNRTKYPSIYRRAFDFFFYEMWSDFWSELPKRLAIATPRDVRLWKDGIKFTLGFSVACAFTLNYDHNSVYFFGMAILLRVSQQTASETLNIGTQRLCGLVVGVAFANVTATKSHNLVEQTALTCCFCFVFMACSVYVPYFNALQYAVVTSITTQRYFVTPETLINRIVDNVFAFVCYLCICVTLFPLDPLRCLNNTRTRILINLNALTQLYVALGCARITRTGEEAQLLLGQAKALLAQTNALLNEYGSWMEKCLNEPMLRGSPYPRAEEAQVLSCLTEFTGLHEAVLHTLNLLHRTRDQMPSTILTDLLVLIHPFLIDVGKLHQKYIQELVDALEKPRGWSMEEAVRVLWKAHLACVSLHHVTGNIQRNFFAAVQEVSGADKKMLNPYLNPSVVESAMMDGVDPAVVNHPRNVDMI